MFFNNFAGLSGSLNCKNPGGQCKNPLKIHLEDTLLSRQNGGDEGKNPKNPKNPPVHPERVYTGMLPVRTADFRDFRDYTVITVSYIRILRRFLLDFINSYREIYFILNHYGLKSTVQPSPSHGISIGGLSLGQRKPAPRKLPCPLHGAPMAAPSLWPLIAARGRLSMAG